MWVGEQLKDDSTINIKIMKMGGVRRSTHSTRSVRASVCCLQKKMPMELLGMRQIEADDESERRTMNRKNGDRKTDERFHAIFRPVFFIAFFRWNCVYAAGPVRSHNDNVDKSGRRRAHTIVHRHVSSSAKSFTWNINILLVDESNIKTKEQKAEKWAAAATSSSAVVDAVIKRTNTPKNKTKQRVVINNIENDSEL